MHDSIQEIEESWHVDDDVDESFYDITNLLNRFRDENNDFYDDDGYDEDEWEKSEAFIQEIETKIKELKRKQSEAVNYDELETEDAPQVILPSGRSIFDDIDE